MNELRVAYQRIRDNRGDLAGQQRFPFVQVDFPDGTNAKFGSEASSHANKLNQNIAELTDDFTLVRGGHTLTLGTHNEFYKFYNLFIQNLYGNYRFSSIANFQAGIAQSYTLNYSNTANPLEAAQFAVRQFGVYAGDQWRIAPSFTLTYGVRLDIPRFPDTPHANPLAVERVRDQDRPGAGADDVVAARRIQLGSQSRHDQPPATARGPRIFHRPHAVRLDVESVRQHRRRFHEPGGELRRGQHHPVRRRPERAAEDGHRRRDRPSDAQSHRPELQVSGDHPRQPRLRPPAGVRADRDGRSAHLEEREGHRLLEHQLRPDRHAARRPAHLHEERRDAERRHPPVEHRQGQQLDDDVQGGAAVRERLLRQRLVSAQPHHGRSTTAPTARRGRTGRSAPMPATT